METRLQGWSHTEAASQMTELDGGLVARECSGAPSRGGKGVGGGGAGGGREWGEGERDRGESECVCLCAGAYVP